MYIKHVMQLLSSNVLNAVNRTIYIYVAFSTKTTIIGHYAVFCGLIQSLDGHNLSSFP